MLEKCKRLRASARIFHRHSHRRAGGVLRLRRESHARRRNHHRRHLRRRRPAQTTLCGLPVALSVIESVPLLAAVPVGVNVTKIVQLAFCAMPLPVVEQVPPETANGPMVVIFEKVTLTVVLLVFFTVTVIGALVVFRFCAGKVSVGGSTVTVAVAVAVVPLNVTVCGFPVALSSNTSVPLLGAVPVGVNVTSTVQALPGVMPSRQVQVPPAAIANGPVVAKLVTTAFATLLTLFVSVTVTGPLVVFCAVAGKDHARRQKNRQRCNAGARQTHRLHGIGPVGIAGNRQSSLHRSNSGRRERNAHGAALIRRQRRAASRRINKPCRSRDARNTHRARAAVGQRDDLRRAGGFTASFPKASVPGETLSGELFKLPADINTFESTT